jgi:hypothetical protein
MKQRFHLCTDKVVALSCVLLRLNEFPKTNLKNPTAQGETKISQEIRKLPDFCAEMKSLFHFMHLCTNKVVAQRGKTIFLVHKQSSCTKRENYLSCAQTK